MKKEKKKKPKVVYIDDGRTIADMNIEGFRWYTSKNVSKQQKELTDLEITPKERRAMIRAAFVVILPIVLYFILGFALVFGLIYWWLS